MVKLTQYPDIVTIDEAMDILRIGRGQCYHLLSSGRLKSFRIGSRNWKIPREAVEEFINNNGNNH